MKFVTFRSRATKTQLDLIEVKVLCFVMNSQHILLISTVFGDHFVVLSSFYSFGREMRYSFVVIIRFDCMVASTGSSTVQATINIIHASHIGCYAPLLSDKTK